MRFKGWSSSFVHQFQCKSSIYRYQILWRVKKWQSLGDNFFRGRDDNFCPVSRETNTSRKTKQVELNSKEKKKKRTLSREERRSAISLLVRLAGIPCFLQRAWRSFLFIPWKSIFKSDSNQFFWNYKETFLLFSSNITLILSLSLLLFSFVCLKISLSIASSF